jgi:hypothetical protein
MRQVLLPAHNQLAQFESQRIPAQKKGTDEFWKWIHSAKRDAASAYTALARRPKSVSNRVE